MAESDRTRSRPLSATRARAALPAFTVIELLVVVSLIVLIIALLLPALGQSRKTARVTVCASNLRGLHMAHQLYTNDNSGRNFKYRNDGIYMTFLEPYHGKVDLLRYCPEVQIIGGGWGSATLGWGYGTYTGAKYGSYGINGFFYHPIGTPTGPIQVQGQGGGSGYFGHVDYHANGWPNYWYKSLSDGRPSFAPVYADCEWVDGWPMPWDQDPGEYSGGWFRGADFRQMARFAINRHDMHINVGFADGTVGLERLDALWTLDWHQQWVPPNPPIAIGP